MTQQYFINDDSFHKACRLCGDCLECRDCEAYGCKVELRVSEKHNQLFDWLLEFGKKDEV
jgi:hypothetical protein